MTDRVIPFKKPDRQFRNDIPHLSGTAQCVSCSRRWEAVAPVGTVELECPACNLNTGRFRNLCEPSDGEWWRCNCGCTLFCVVKDAGYMCSRCGEWQRGF